MTHTNFCSIGKAVITRAIGLQDNHKVSKLDRKRSGCFVCPHFIEMAKSGNTSMTCDACSTCPTKVYMSQYINEKNRYGYSHPLKLHAIHLFLYLHFLSPSSCGIVSDFHAPTVAKTLNCTEKTVHNNLRKLQECGYIHYLPDEERGYYIIVLPEYESYFKPASEGGRGYFVLSWKTMQEFLKTSQLNVFRIYMRTYLNIDQKKSSSDYSDIRTIRELRNYLPAYIKPCNIRNFLQKETNLFQIEVNREVMFTLHSEFYGEYEKNLLMEENEARLGKHFESSNMLLQKRTTTWIPSEDIPEYLHSFVQEYLETKEMPYIQLSTKEESDLIQMTLQYSYESVEQALHYLWMHNKPSSLINNYGKFVRTVLDNHFFSSAA